METSVGEKLFIEKRDMIVAYWKPTASRSFGGEDKDEDVNDDADQSRRAVVVLDIDEKKKKKKKRSVPLLETIDFPPSSYVRFNAAALEKLNRSDEDVNNAQKTRTRAEVTSYRRREPKERGPFVVGLTDRERERIKEQFYVVEVFYDVQRRKGEEGEEEVERRSEKFVFATNKEKNEIEELKETNAEEYVKDSGCRFHEVQYARRFVCKEVTAIDDEPTEEAEEEAEAKEKTNKMKKRTKQRYAVRIGRVEDARAGSRMVCGSVVEVRRLDFVSDRGGGDDVGDEKATKRKRSEKDAETDRNKLLRVLEKITATAEGILADERRKNASAAETGEEGAGTAPAGGGAGEGNDADGGEKSGEFVDATAKWTLRNATKDAFDVHPAAMYCALIASVNLEQ
jgi:hypothetical protein